MTIHKELKLKSFKFVIHSQDPDGLLEVNICPINSSEVESGNALNGFFKNYEEAEKAILSFLE